MAFSPEFLDEIRNRLAVSEVVGRRVRLTKAGREYKGLCPFHNEKTPSFYVNDDKAFYHCFGCGAHGDVIGFSMRAEGLEFRDAIERLAGLAGLELPVETPAQRQREEARKTLHQVVEAACAWFEAQLRPSGGRAALTYLRGRGLDDATIARFRLGFAPDGRTALKDALKTQGIDEAMLLEAGLLTRPEEGGESYDFFRGRVMFPITDRRGQVIAFGGRVLGDGQPKYLNSRDTPLFDKGRNLYALDKAREGVRAGAQLVVAEGYMDVIALHSVGLAGAVAPLGTALTEAQIELLWKMAPVPVLCFDGDTAGQRATLRAAARALPLLIPGFSLGFATLPAGDDPDSLVRKRGSHALTEIFAASRPLVDVVWEAEIAGRSLDTPEQRAALRAALAERVRAIADRTVQNEYYQTLVVERFGAVFHPRQTNRRGRRGRSPGQRVTAPGFAPSLGANGNVAAVAARPAEALLAALINHPGLLVEEFETLARIELPSAELDSIHKEILNVAACNPDLDSATLQNHLMAVGLAGTVQALLQPNLYIHWSFANPAAGLDAARAGVKGIMSGLDRRKLLNEVTAAATEEGNWDKLPGLQRQVIEIGDEDGESSGAEGAPSGHSAK
jgi:DNA primase